MQKRINGNKRKIIKTQVTYKGITYEKLNSNALRCGMVQRYKYLTLRAVGCYYEVAFQNQKSKNLYDTLTEARKVFNSFLVEASKDFYYYDDITPKGILDVEIVSWKYNVKLPGSTKMHNVYLIRIAYLGLIFFRKLFAKKTIFIDDLPVPGIRKKYYSNAYEVSKEDFDKFMKENSAPR